MEHFCTFATIRDLTLAHIRHTNAPDRDQEYPDRRNIGQLDELEVLVRFSAVRIFVELDLVNETRQRVCAVAFHTKVSRREPIRAKAMSASVNIKLSKSESHNL